MQGRREQTAKGQNGQPFAAAAHFSFAKRQALQVFLGHGAHTGTARIAHRHGVVLRIGGAEQLAAFALIGGACQAHVGNAANVGNVVGPRVGGAIGAHQASAVNSKHHGQVLQGHVVNELVVGALQKGRVNRHHRLQAFAGHASGKSHGVLFGNASVVIALRKSAVKLHHARAFAHGGCDAHQPWVLLGHVAQPLTKHLCESGFGRRGGSHQTHTGVKLAGAVVGHRIDLGQFVTLAFFGDDMQELRTVQVFDVFQSRDQ